MSYWRAQAKPIIERVLRECRDEGITDTAVIRARLRPAYPFGLRQYWPYKVWLDEIRAQLGEKKPRSRKRRTVRPRVEATALLFPEVGR